MSQEDFDKAYYVVRNLEKRPSHADLSDIYGLYKQATVGDVSIERPRIFDFTGKSKWDAWNSKKGMSKEDAIKGYISKAEEMKVTYST
ncbi:acyl-CoA-binding protein [Aplochiton taeniatus]